MGFPGGHAFIAKMVAEGRDLSGFPGDDRNALGGLRSDVVDDLGDRIESVARKLPDQLGDLAR